MSGSERRPGGRGEAGAGFGRQQESSPRRSGWQPRGYSGVTTAPEPVAGDVVLSAEGATSNLSNRRRAGDLAAASTARLGGRAIALAGLVVVVGVVLSRVLGWARTSVFGAEFGLSGQLDPFWVAFRVPDTLFQLVAAGAVGSALVPVASELLANGESDRARRLVATLTNLMVLVLVPLAMLAWLMTPQLIKLFAQSPDPSVTSSEIWLTRVMLLSPILLAVGAVMSAGLNSAGIFGAPAMAPNVYNIAIIACAIVLTPFFGITALALGVVIGAAGHVAIQAVAVRRNGLYSPTLDVRDPAVRQTLTLLAPRALGLGATQIVFLVNTYFATGLGYGPLSIYNFAFTALQIPVGLVGVPLGIVLLPPLSQAIARGDDERFRSLVDQSLRMLLFVVIPLTGFMFALATPGLSVLYQYGKATNDEIGTMTPVFLFFLVGLVAHVLIALLAPIFYAGKDTRTPVTAALVAVAVDVGAAMILFGSMHLEGLALAIGLGAWAEVVILLAFMERRTGFDLRPIGERTIAFCGGAIVASAAALLGYKLVEQAIGSGGLIARLADLGAGGLAGVAVYVAWSFALRLPELDDSIVLARTLLRRQRAVEAGDGEDDF